MVTLGMSVGQVCSNSKIVVCNNSYILLVESELNEFMKLKYSCCSSFSSNHCTLGIQKRMYLELITLLNELYH